MKKKISLLLAAMILMTGCNGGGQGGSSSAISGGGQVNTSSRGESSAPSVSDSSSDTESTENTGGSDSAPESSAPTESDNTQGDTPQDGAPKVYMTTDISPEGLKAVYDALGWSPTGNVAVKLSTGEPPASNYLRPELIGDLVKAVGGTIVECNTAYGGSRAETAMHYQAAKYHGFTDIADFRILDEDGSMTLPVTGGTQLSENYVGAHFADYDSYPVYSAEDGGSLIKRIESRNGLHTLEHAAGIGLGSRDYELISVEQ